MLQNISYLLKGDLFLLGFSVLDEIVVWPGEILDCPTCGPNDKELVMSFYTFCVEMLMSIFHDIMDIAADFIM